MRSVVALLAVGLASCDGGGPARGSCVDGASVSNDDACMLDSSLYFQPCSGKVVTEIPADDCPTQGCSGKSAYAVCNGKEWGPCSCTIPRGYELIDAGFFGPEGGDETGPASDAASTPPG